MYGNKSVVIKESDAAVLIKTVIKALLHCHSKNIIHRDLKPENIMFNNEVVDDFTDIQIIDFGLAGKTSDPFGLLKTMVGSPYFTAPEVYEGSYGKACDVWSCGVILYELLSGTYPYIAKTPSLLYETMQKKEVKFPIKTWENISKDVQDLLSKMIDSSPYNRITFEECLKHRWFTGTNAKTVDSNNLKSWLNIEYNRVID
jgi:calcium-dependent protein kinase